MKFQQLKDLKAAKRALDAAAAQRAAEAAAAAEAAERRRLLAQEQAVFQQALHQSMGRVQPLAAPPRVALRTEPPPPVPVQKQRDEQAVLREALSDGFDASTLLDTDDGLSFRRPGVGRDVVHKLRRGDWRIQAEMDLHGCRTDEAREQLAQFVREAHREGLRCLRVVHGKGLGSPGREPVLKGKVHSWLVQKQQVLAFVQAPAAQGGAGALLVLLTPSQAVPPGARNR